MREKDEWVLTIKNYLQITLFNIKVNYKLVESGVERLNKNGKITKEFVFEGVLDSVTLKGNYISFLSENNLFLYNLKGQLISKKPCEFGVSFAVPISRRQAALILDNKINKLTF